MALVKGYILKILFYCILYDVYVFLHGKKSICVLLTATYTKDLSPDSKKWSVFAIISRQ